jgi:hypothetical protein
MYFMTPYDAPRSEVGLISSSDEMRAGFTLLRLKLCMIRPMCTLGALF